MMPAMAPTVHGPGDHGSYLAAQQAAAAAAGGEGGGVTSPGSASAGGDGGDIFPMSPDAGSGLGERVRLGDSAACLPACYRQCSSETACLNESSKGFALPPAGAAGLSIRQLRCGAQPFSQVSQPACLPSLPMLPAALLLLLPAAAPGWHCQQLAALAGCMPRT